MMMTTIHNDESIMSRRSNSSRRIRRSRSAFTILPVSTLLLVNMQLLLLLLVSSLWLLDSPVVVVNAFHPHHYPYQNIIFERILLHQQRQHLPISSRDYNHHYHHSIITSSTSSLVLLSLSLTNLDDTTTIAPTDITSTTTSDGISSRNDDDITTATATTTNIPIEWQGEILSKLRTIIDPDLHMDIVTLGFIQNLQYSTSSSSSSSSIPMVEVSFNVVLTTPACPIREQFKLDCEQNVLQLPWVDTVIVNMTSSTTTTIQNTDPLLSGMAQVGAIIAVSSCKGGVGKSTTAVNLAFALQQLSPDVNVAIFDADVYGPSLPTMVKPDNDIVQFIGRQIAPLRRNNVKLMSFGYVSDDAAILRGPIITQLLDQIISVTQWGKIDYMIIDMPPGTGDIPLTLTQRLNITAAVIVTTPQELSYTDVVRGINMFDSVNVPCIAVVENMAYYEIDTTKTATTTSITKTMEPKEMIDINQLKLSITDKLNSVEGLNGSKMNGDKDDSTSSAAEGMNVAIIDVLANELVDIVVQQLSSTPLPEQSENIEKDDIRTTTMERVPIFGLGHTKRLSDQFGIELVYSIPLVSNIATNGDSGTPYVLEYPHSPPSLVYKSLAASVVQEVAKIQYIGTSQRPNIIYNREDHTIVMNNINIEQNEKVVTTGTEKVTTKETDDYTMTPANLRRACRCAYCVEEISGRQILVPSTIPETVYPKKMYPTGNYAISIDWSDGHRSLYPYKQIKSLVLESENRKVEGKAVQ